MLIKKQVKDSIFIIIVLFLSFNLSCGNNNPDKSSPAPGNSGIIVASDITAHSLTLTWTAAEDNRTGRGGLEYLVYISLSNNIDSLANVRENGTPFEDWTSGITTISVTGLIGLTPYYLNLIVRDEAGNMAAYAMLNVETPDGTPPSVTITAPADEDYFGDVTVTVQAEASDNVLVEKVVWFVDGEKIETDDVQPYEFSIYMGPFLSGSLIVIPAVAYDSRGNSNYDTIAIYKNL